MSNVRLDELPSSRKGVEAVTFVLAEGCIQDQQEVSITMSGQRMEGSWHFRDRFTHLEQHRLSYYGTT